jgi:hypothetical protein
MMEFVAKPACIVFEAPDQARFEKTQALLAYWRQLQALHARPTRAELDPAAMKPFLANLLTGNVEPKPFRVHYKLVGTRVAECSRYDFTNRYLDELATEDRDDVDWEACYRQLHRLRQPMIGEATVKDSGGAPIDSYEFAILPLWRGEDPAGSFVAIEVYDGIVAHRIPEWSRVLLRA